MLNQEISPEKVQETIFAPKNSKIGHLDSENGLQEPSRIQNMLYRIKNDKILQIKLVVLFLAIFFYYISIKDIIMVILGFLGCIIGNVYYEYKKYLKQKKIKSKIKLQYRKFEPLIDDSVKILEYENKGAFINKWNKGAREILMNQEIGDDVQIFDRLECDFEEKMKIRNLTEISDFKRECLDFYNSAISLAETPAEHYIDSILRKSISEVQEKQEKFMWQMKSQPSTDINRNITFEKLIKKSDKYTKILQDLKHEKKKFSSLDTINKIFLDVLKKWQESEIEFSQGLSQIESLDGMEKFINLFSSNLPEDEIMSTIDQCGDIEFSGEETNFFSRITEEINCYVHNQQGSNESVYSLFLGQKDTQNESEKNMDAINSNLKTPSTNRKKSLSPYDDSTERKQSKNHNESYLKTSPSQGNLNSNMKMQWPHANDSSPMRFKTPVSSHQQINVITNTCKLCQNTYEKTAVNSAQIIKGTGKKSWKQLKQFLMRLGQELQKCNNQIKKNIETTVFLETDQLRRKIQVHEAHNNQILEKLKLAEEQFNTSKYEFYQLKNKLLKDIQVLKKSWKKDFELDRQLDLEMKFRKDMYKVNNEKIKFLDKMMNMKKILKEIQSYSPENNTKILGYVNDFLSLKEIFQRNFTNAYYCRNKLILMVLYFTISNDKDFDYSINEIFKFINKAINELSFCEVNINNNIQIETTENIYAFPMPENTNTVGENFAYKGSENNSPYININSPKILRYNDYLKEYSGDLDEADLIKCEVVRDETAEGAKNQKTGEDCLASKLTSGSCMDMDEGISINIPSNNLGKGLGLSRRTMQQFNMPWNTNSTGNEENNPQNVYVKLDEIEKSFMYYEENYNKIDNLLKFGKKGVTTIEKIVKTIKKYNDGLLKQESKWLKIEKEFEIYSLISESTDSSLHKENPLFRTTNSVPNKNSVSGPNLKGYDYKSVFLDMGAGIHNLEQIHKPTGSTRPSNKQNSLANMIKLNINVTEKFINKAEKLMTKQSEFINKQSDIFKDLENTKKKLQVKIKSFREKIHSKFRDINQQSNNTDRVSLDDLLDFENLMVDEINKLVLLKKSIGLKLNDCKKELILLLFRMYKEQLSYFESNYLNFFDNMIERRKSINPFENFDTFIKEGECENLVKMLSENDPSPEKKEPEQIKPKKDTIDVSLSQKFKTTDQEDIDYRNVSKPEYIWVNKFLNVMIKEWFVNEFFYFFVGKELLDVINKDNPPWLGEFTFKELKLSKDSPIVHEVTMKKSEPYEILADIELSYNGKIHVRMETSLNFTFITKPFKIPITVAAEQTSFFAVLRLCFVPVRHGMSWLSFMGEPIMNQEFQPLINGVDYLEKFPQLVPQLEKGLGFVFKKLIFPNRIDIDVPLSCGANFPVPNQSN